MLKDLAVFGTARIDLSPVVDPIIFQRPSPPAEIPSDGRLRHHHVVGEARAVGKAQASGALNTRRTGGVIEEDAVWFQMILDEGEEFSRQQVADIGPEKEGRIGDDGVESAAWIHPQ